jgi:hypothetical protein
MDKLLLDDLQRRIAYPSVTVLVNTTPGSRLSDAELTIISGFVDDADRRLTDDVPDATRITVVKQLHELIRSCIPETSSEALALCASPEHATAVRLGRAVAARVVVDDTFATRDLVADLNRSAVFRVLTVSGRRARLLRGDRNRLVEHDDEVWPMERGGEAAAAWARRVAGELNRMQAEESLPTVLAGVSSSVRAVIDACPWVAIGVVRGNHDRTSWSDLHNAAWPVMVDWLRSDRADAIARLDQARSGTASPAASTRSGRSPWMAASSSSSSSTDSRWRSGSGTRVSSSAPMTSRHPTSSTTSSTTPSKPCCAVAVAPCSSTTGRSTTPDASPGCCATELRRERPRQPRSSRPRMSCSVRAPARAPSPSRTLLKRSDLRALSSMTFSSMVSVET